MVLTQNCVVIPIGNTDPAEYIQNLQTSFHTLFNLIFSYRELDLDEKDLFALYMANNLMSKLIEYPKQ